MGGTKQGHKGEARSGEAGMGVSRKRESQRHPARASRPQVKRKGPKGYREEVAGHGARPAGRSSPSGESSEWDRGAQGHQRSSGLGRLEPSTGPGNQYLDKRLHLQVEFDNLLVTDPDVDILGSRHVGDAGYGQRRWPSFSAFSRRPVLRQRPLETGPGRARVAAPSPGNFP